MIKKFWRKNNILLVFVAAILYALPACDKFWSSLDEGFILEAGRMAAGGMVPYRDFFLLLYPPGDTYVLAALFKIFGVNLMVGRIYAIFLQAAICSFVFYFVRRFANTFFALISFVICLSTMSSRIGPFSTPIWPATVLTFCSAFFMLNFIESCRRRDLLMAGFFVGLASLFRHDIGILAFIAGCATLFVYEIYKTQDEKRGISKFLIDTLKLWGAYAVFPVVLAFLLGLWLFSVGALNDAFRSLAVFPAVFCKVGRMPFPPFCFDLNMIFHKGCLFIERNQFYIPVLMCAVTAVFIILQLVTGKKLNKRLVCLVMFLFLGAAYLQQSIVRADSSHLAISVIPAAILFGLIFKHETDHGQNSIKIFKILAVSTMALLMALYVFENVSVYIKKVYTIPFKRKTVRPVTFRNGTVYVPNDERAEVVSLAEYIENNTREDEKIYIGNLHHSVPHFGWHTILYFLAGRFPAVKYYEIHPGLQDRDDIQNEMMLSLEKNMTRVVILKDYDDKEFVLGPLDKYIREKYKLDKIIGSSHAYIKK